MSLVRQSNSRAIFPWPAALALALLLTGCGKSSQDTAFDLPIYFTCDTHGRLEPCGCFIGQYGGLTRLKTVLDAEKSPGALRLDVGDSIGGKEDYDWIEYRYQLKAFAVMNYDAINIGGREAQLTAQQLMELKQSSPVPLLSANLLARSNQQPVFDSYKIFQRGSFRVAVIGVLDPKVAEENLGDGLVIGDMDAAITRCLTELHAKADIIILLAFTDEANLSRLAQNFFECQVILGGKVSQPAQQLVHENRSLIYYVTNESRAVALLRLRLSTGRALEVTGNEIRLLRDNIPQAPQCQELMQAYRDEVKHTVLKVDDPRNLAADMVPGVRATAEYVGTEQCLSCHPGAAEVWKESAHAHAFEALVNHQAEADPKCITCHAVGFGRESGYRREFAATKLVEVGCESCHGPGSLHVRETQGDTSVHFTFRPLEEGDCRSCHFGEFSRPFHYDEFWETIRHGKEPSQTKATP